MQKYISQCSEEIYYYSLKLENGEDFCRINITTNIITKEKKNLSINIYLFLVILI